MPASHLRPSKFYKVGQNQQLGPHPIHLGQSVQSIHNSLFEENMTVFKGILLSGALIGLAFAQTSATGGANTTSATQATTPATSASTQTNSTTSAAAQSGAVVPVELSKSIDSKKAKVGDEVTGKVLSDVRSGGSVAIPRGSRLLGKITEANARGKGDATSSLGIAFDRAVLKDGSTLNLVSTIQAVIAPPQLTPPSMGEEGGASAPAPNAGGGGMAGPIASTTGAVANTAGSAVGAVGQTAGSAVGDAGADVGLAAGANSPAITSRTVGVVGIKGLELNASADSNSSGSLFTSSGKSVKLDGGTRLLVNVSAASPGQAETKK
jgi:hypothetical protein